MGFDADVSMFEGTVLFYPGDPSARFTPSLAAGGGAVSHARSFARERDAMRNLGGGARLELGDVMVLRFGLRDYMSTFDAVPENEDLIFQNNVVLTTGLVLSPF